MSTFHNIFCASDGDISRSDIAEYAEDGWYGDGEPSFTPMPGPEAQWDCLEMRLPGIRRPIIFLHDTGPEAAEPYVSEVLTERADRLPTQVADQIRQTRQVIGIELWPETLDDDAWELLDQIQGFIAQRLTGILITEDGVYDANLQVLS